MFHQPYTCQDVCIVFTVKQTVKQNTFMLVRPLNYAFYILLYYYNSLPKLLWFNDSMLFQHNMINGMQHLSKRGTIRQTLHTAENITVQIIWYMVLFLFRLTCCSYNCYWSEYRGRFCRPWTGHSWFWEWVRNILWRPGWGRALWAQSSPAGRLHMQWAIGYSSTQSTEGEKERR